MQSDLQFDTESQLYSKADPPSRSLSRTKFRGANRLRLEDHGIHDWYRFVLSFPPHLVRDYINKFGLSSAHCVLDPFCGTGTTLVECKKLGLSSIGIEANPIAWFASTVKTDWYVNPKDLLRHAKDVAEITAKKFEKEGIQDAGGPLLSRKIGKLKSIPIDQQRLILSNSISPLPLHKTLTLLESLRETRDERYEKYELLALAKAIVFGISNLHFGPEVGVRSPKPDAPVLSIWLTALDSMAHDLQQLAGVQGPSTVAYKGDARALNRFLEDCSIDAVITSPPYPNEKDYTRTTRLESVLLGFIRNKEDLRDLKKQLVRSNTRSVYKTDNDDELIAGHKEIQQLAEEIESRRIQLGKTSGFERLYPRLTKLYFGGMARHLSDLRRPLRPGARLAYVVGDQASYLQVMIHTGKLLADIAASLGYEVLSIDLFRTRAATATKAELREEVVVLRWPG